MSIVSRIDAEGRLPIPAELQEEFAPDQEVELVRCEEGVLVKPMGNARLIRALKRKLTMNRPMFLDLSDVDMDELGW